MGRKKKLKRFAEIKELPNVLENPDPRNPVLYKSPFEQIELLGVWADKHFGNANPIVLELACGRGEYTITLAERYPQKNFIGVDIKGARIWKGATYASKEDLGNVAFLRTRIECIDAFFAEGEVSEIWVTFPDPFPKKTDINRRLTSPVFLDKYASFLMPGGIFHLKTDDQDLFEFSINTIRSKSQWEILVIHRDIYAGDLPLEELAIKTYYEKKHLEDGKTIKYIQARLGGGGSC